jgi:hypothetical protein
VALPAIDLQTRPARAQSRSSPPRQIGQTGEESWTVLADPEGNEFCILRPKKTLIT